MNDYIETKLFKIQTLDKLFQPNFYTAKVNLQHAYCSIPIHLMNYHFTSLKWKFSGDAHITYLYDTRLPYSAKSSPEIFHHFMQSVHCMMAKERVHWSHSLLWWFSDHWGSTWVVQTGLWYASADTNLFPPTQHVPFLGVQLDTTACMMTLPATKLAKL